jgi:hypothetical protein
VSKRRNEKNLTFSSWFLSLLPTSPTKARSSQNITSNPSDWFSPWRFSVTWHVGSDDVLSRRCHSERNAEKVSYFFYEAYLHRLRHVSCLQWQWSMVSKVMSVVKKWL